METTSLGLGLEFMGQFLSLELEPHVAVNGLYPIMDRLVKKLKAESKPGSIVVSNVFEIPNWRASTRVDKVSVKAFTCIRCLDVIHLHLQREHTTREKRKSIDCFN